MDGTFLDVGDSFRQYEVTVGNLLQKLEMKHTKVRTRRTGSHNPVGQLIARFDTQGH